jgi:hypothetical protein
VRVDKDMMALLKATKKASEPLGATVERLRRTDRKRGPSRKFPEPEQNAELYPAGPVCDAR